jgi:SsrA-binding protein
MPGRTRAATTKGSDRKGPAHKVLARNRRARHDYDVIETYECGIALVGSEVKSLREGRVHLKDSYARVEQGEVWLHGVHVAPYAFAQGRDGHDPDRPRKLLLHRHQIDELTGRTQQEGLTLVPLSLYLKEGRVKAELALARGRRRYDKRRAIAEREARREAERALARSRRNDPGPGPLQCGGSHTTGVHGFDFGGRSGRSEPWSPDPRKRAGT